MACRLSMTLLVLAFSCFSLSLAVLFGDSLSSSSLPVPCFLWSSKDLLQSQRNVYKNLAGITQNDLADFVLNELLQTNDPPKSVDFSLGKPKAVVVFLVDELSASDVSTVANAYSLSEASTSDVFLKKTMLTEGSSVVFPYTLTSQSGVLSPWSQLLQTAKAFGVSTQYISSTEEEIKAVKDEKLKQLAVVYVGKVYDKNADILLGEYYSKFVKIFGDEFVALFSGLGPRKQLLEQDVALYGASEVLIESADHFEIEQRRQLKADEVVRGSTFIRSDPQLISAMLVSLFLLIMVTIYLCCLDCVETPQRFASRYPYKGKEFN